MESALNNLLHRFKPKKLLDTVALWVLVLVIFILFAIGLLFSDMIYNVIEGQTEKRALQSARYVALIPELRTQNLPAETSLTLSTLLESILLEEKITQITVSDRSGSTQLAVGQGGPEDVNAMHEQTRALRHGRTSVSRQQTAAGSIVTAFAPVFDENFNVLGAVSVTYQVENLRDVTREHVEKLLFYIWLFITLGLAVAIFIALRVKKATFNLEPTEIATLFQEREAIIASIREGVIATDEQRRIVMMNDAARGYLSALPKNSTIDQVFPDIDFNQVFLMGTKILDKKTHCAGVGIILSSVPIVRESGISGAVLTFRRLDEVEVITRELSQVQAYSEMLRAQTHEYNNRLHAIVGMLQTGAYDEVLDFIAEETTSHRLLIRQLTETIPDPILSSFLIGKHMYAQELKVDFSIDKESHLIDIPNSLNRHQLVTILGNVINNACEAALAAKRPPRVRLFMSDYGNDIIFEVEDSGEGIAEHLVTSIFTKGVSTKSGEKRGYGLHLVKKALESMAGGISVQQGELGGACFVIEIPKIASKP